MSDRIGRNDPCPCGSGKKYKSCCGQKPRHETTEPEVSGPFRFEPGCYEVSGFFLPSISCLKETKPGEWDHHFVLAKPAQPHREEDEAVEEAGKDLQNAFRRKQQTGSEIAVAEYLRSRGYLSVTGFQIAGK